MLRATGTWVCDTCGGVIKDVGDGYVVWKTDNDHKAYSFRIIHQKRCDPNAEYLSSCALRDFVGSDGVARLLAFLSLGPLKQYPETPDFCRIKDFGEFVDLFRRIQTPYYEKARKFLSDPEVREGFADSNEYLPYTEEALKGICSRFLGQA